MPTVTDLYEVLGRRPGYDYGRLRYIVRCGQREQLLPVGGRGKAAAIIGLDDLVNFVLVWAAVELVGDAKAGAVAREFAAMKNLDNKDTFAERLRDLIERYPRPHRLAIKGSWRLYELRFSATGPEAVLEFSARDHESGKPDEGPPSVRFSYAPDNLQHDSTPSDNLWRIKPAMIDDLAALLTLEKTSELVTA